MIKEIVKTDKAQLRIIRCSTGLHDYRNHCSLQNWVGIACGILIGRLIVNKMGMVPPDALLAPAGILAFLMAIVRIVRVFYQKGSIWVSLNDMERFVVDDDTGFLLWETGNTQENSVLRPMCKCGFSIQRFEDKGNVNYRITGKPSDEFIAYVDETFATPQGETIFGIKAVSLMLSFDRRENAGEIDGMEKFFADCH